jgi:hypothetical protein
MSSRILPRKILGVTVDERFLDHRRRSSTLAMIAGALVSGSLFEYRLIAQHRYDWGMAAVLLAMLATKLTAMTWLRFAD